MNGIQKLSLSAIAIATTLGLNISLSPDATLMGEVGLRAQAQGNVDVNKAHCGRYDNAETGLQGQIPMPDRLAGFQGFNCNLEKTASAHASRGDGL
jgi:hypothetical protein